MAKQDKLTQLVLEYKQTRREAILTEILTLTEGLIYTIFSFYGVNNADPSIQEDIKADCVSTVLLRTIEAFDSEKGAKFSTFYVWRLKSHIRSRKEFYLRRKPVLQTQPLDTLLGYDDGQSINLSDVLHNFNLNTLHRTKKAIRESFVA